MTTMRQRASFTLGAFVLVAEAVLMFYSWFVGVIAAVVAFQIHRAMLV